MSFQHARHGEFCNDNSANFFMLLWLDKNFLILSKIKTEFSLEKAQFKAFPTKNSGSNLSFFPQQKLSDSYLVPVH